MSSTDKVYSNRGNRAVVDLVDERTKSVLDLGCGTGDNASHLVRRNISVDGVTYSKQEAEIAAGICRKVLVHDLNKGLPEDLARYYDACICSHFLEHIAWPELLLADIRKRLEPETGYLIVALPNIMHYPSRLQLLSGNFDYQTDGVMDDTHLRWYTFKTGRQLLESNGFEVKRAFVEGAFPLYKLRKIIPARLVAGLNRLACSLRPGLFGAQLLYLAYPKPDLKSSAGKS